MKLQIETLIENEKYTEALEILDKALEQDAKQIDLLFYKANINQKLGKTANAVNIYTQILEFEPENKRAEIERELIHMIMLQENNDKFESTNLYDDPWL
jgi:tetratricopeptide (TPR) repeat protein